jgi:hypothetical protein
MAKFSIRLLSVFTILFFTISANFAADEPDENSDFMNIAEGTITICPPKKVFEQIFIQSARKFLNKYGSEHKLYDFVKKHQTAMKESLNKNLNREDAQRVTIIDSLFTDPQLEEYAELTDLFTSRNHKQALYTMAQYFSKDTPSCNRSKGKLNGGIKLNVDGRKATGYADVSSYLFKDKDSDYNHIKIPIWDRLISIGVNRDYQFPYMRAYGSLSNPAYKVTEFRHLEKPELSLNAFFHEKPFGFLQKKLAPGESKTVNRRNSGIFALSYSRHTFCTMPLQITGFCNFMELGRISAGNFAFVPENPEELNEPYHLKKVDTTDPDISFPGVAMRLKIIKAKVRKSRNQNGVYEGSYRFVAKPVKFKFPGLLVEGKGSFAEGTDLPTEKKTYEALESGSLKPIEEINFVEKSKEYMDDLLVNIFQPRAVALTSKEAVTNGVAPEISWNLNDIEGTGGSHSAKADANGFRVYRNDELIATLDKTVSSFTDTELYSNSNLAPGTYRYSVTAVNSRNEEGNFNHACDYKDEVEGSVYRYQPICFEKVSGVDSKTVSIKPEIRINTSDPNFHFVELVYLLGKDFEESFNLLNYFGNSDYYNKEVKINFYRDDFNFEARTFNSLNEAYIYGLEYRSSDLQSSGSGESYEYYVTVELDGKTYTSDRVSVSF